MAENIQDIRKEYTAKTLEEMEVKPDAVEQFKVWFDEALHSSVTEANAMNLATASDKGIPSSRVVLLKGIEDGGFTFYTNYQSRKGKEIESNPAVALTFFWPELERQVRIQGLSEKLSEEVSEAYFQSRPKASQIGAWSSPQSAVIASRGILEKREKELQEKFKDEDVLPKPKQWGGYRVMPYLIEFWQGRAGRLHDRILYTLKNDIWQINRLAP